MYKSNQGLNNWTRGGRERGGKVGGKEGERVSGRRREGRVGEWEEKGREGG